MAKHYHSEFDPRQEMQAADYEIYYYEDKDMSDVSMHRHDYYEIYFFLGGSLSYQIGKNLYPMKYGDICLIPPGIFHRPQFADHSIPYRRMVLWVSPTYLRRLENVCPDITYGFTYGNRINCHHFSSDFSNAQILFGKLIEVIEEQRRQAPFHDTMVSCCITSLLLSVNRIIQQQESRQTRESEVSQNTLFSGLCEYMNAHLEEDLSLDALATAFYVSKYHIAHVFKENMGMSVHQYLLKKRLYACKNAILAGTPLHEVSSSYGFRDYTSFFRAFKKEFGIGPKDYKETFHLPQTGTGSPLQNTEIQRQ
jgi:AraC-like DNA-binding protein